MDALTRMKELATLLDEAARAYYQEGREIMPNERYDKLYDELAELEKQTGTVFSMSPTHKVGYEVLSELPKERHEKRALSLDKTKEVETLQEFLGDVSGVLSWKLDGLTVVLTYDGGALTKAVTRGNGEVGEVVTNNARRFRNLPLSIPFKGHLVLRGEAVIRYSDFERQNAELDENAKYKNPRNLSAGSVRQLDPAITAKRCVNLIAFALIDAEGADFGGSMNEQLNFLDRQGFETVERVMVTRDSLPAAIRRFSERVAEYDVPSDGLVLVMDDLKYGESLGTTAKFPRNAMAFKWRDEMASATLLSVEWSASRTGLINPVAVFTPVELEGTIVSRASVHNVSIIEELQLGLGDEIRVYKANMIIPQIAENLTKSGTLEIPSRCPVCGAPTVLRDEEGVRTLHCPNKDCSAKAIKHFTQAVSRDALNIEGLSESTLERLVDRGFVKTPGDLFRLSRYRDEISAMSGFGEKSFENLRNAAENARKTTMARVILTLGIPGVGVAGGKLLASYFHDEIEAFFSASEEELTAIPGIGSVTAHDIRRFLDDPKNRAWTDDLLSEVTIEKEENGTPKTLEGKTFVITGSVSQFKNRDELKAFIEARGGSVASSVSKNTDYLINNDLLSNSSKNKKAKELSIPILSEEAFLSMERGG